MMYSRILLFLFFSSKLLAAADSGVERDLEWYKANLDKPRLILGIETQDFSEKQVSKNYKRIVVKYKTAFMNNIETNHPEVQIVQILADAKTALIAQLQNSPGKIKKYLTRAELSEESRISEYYLQTGKESFEEIRKLDKLYSEIPPGEFFPVFINGSLSQEIRSVINVAPLWLLANFKNRVSSSRFLEFALQVDRAIHLVDHPVSTAYLTSLYRMIIGLQFYPTEDQRSSFDPLQLKNLELAIMLRMAHSASARGMFSSNPITYLLVKSALARKANASADKNSSSDFGGAANKYIYEQIQSLWSTPKRYQVIVSALGIESLKRADTALIKQFFAAQDVHSQDKTELTEHFNLFKKLFISTKHGASRGELVEYIKQQTKYSDHRSLYRPWLVKESAVRMCKKAFKLLPGN